MAEAVEQLEITVKFKEDTVLLQGEDFSSKDVLDLELPKLLENGGAQELDLSYVVDLSQQGEQKLQEAAKTCLVEAKDAEIAGYDPATGHLYLHPGADRGAGGHGRHLQSVRQLLSQKHGGDIQAAFLETKPVHTQEELSQRFQLMSTYSTYSENTEAGTANMALALSK